MESKKVYKRSEIMAREQNFFCLMELWIGHGLPEGAVWCVSMTWNDDVRSVSNLKLPNTPEPGAASSI